MTKELNVADVLTEKQIMHYINGFMEFKAREGAKSIVYQASPEVGVWVDNVFYSKTAILKPLNEKFKVLNDGRKSK